MRKVVVCISLIYLFFVLLFINMYLLDGIPHVPDSASYYFMAKIIASGFLKQDIPIQSDFVDFFPGLLNVSNGKWQFQYPIGHPLLLSIGMLTGFPQIIPPIIGTLTIGTLFLILKKIHDPVASYILFLLPFLSPFFLMNASSYMGHNTAAFYLSLALLFLIFAIKNLWYLGFFLTGMCIGLLFNTRPLTAVPFGVIFFFFIFFFPSIKRFRAEIYFVLGGFVLLGIWGGTNYLVSGNILHSSYYQQSHGFFFNNEMLPQFLISRSENFIILLKNFFYTMYNIPWILLLPLLLLPFVFRKDTVWDRLFLVCIISLPIVYFFYNGTFLMYGPRFWYEIIPFVFLLSARSLSILWHRNHLFTFVGILCISVFVLLRFTSIIPASSPDMMSPLQLTTLKSFNSVDSRIIEKIKTKNITNAVVFIKSCDSNWWCYGSVFPQNNPQMTTSVVYVKDLGLKRNRELLTTYPFRKFYLADYERNTLEEYQLY